MLQFDFKDVEKKELLGEFDADGNIIDLEADGRNLVKVGLIIGLPEISKETLFDWKRCLDIINSDREEEGRRPFNLNPEDFIGAKFFPNRGQIHQAAERFGKEMVANLDDYRSR